CRSEEF
ncbi:transcriptional regulator family protein, partial [Chlamydia psittaci 84-8471/1]